MAPSSRAGRRADRLTLLHRELGTLIRTARAQRQADLFAPATPDFRTAEASTAARTVTLSLRETFDLFRAALPPSAKDASSRRRHALLIIAVRHLLDMLRTIETNQATPAAIAAAELVGKQVRIWLRHTERPKVKRVRRPKPAPAQGVLLLPLNRRQLLRQKATTLHNVIPVRSIATPDQASHSDESRQSGTTNNDFSPPPRRTA